VAGTTNAFEHKLPKATTIVRSQTPRRCVECSGWIAKNTWHLSHRHDVLFSDDSRRRTHLDCVKPDDNPTSIMSLMSAALRNHDLETIRQALVKQNRN